MDNSTIQKRSSRIKNPEDKRTEYVHYKANPAEKGRITMNAHKCGMSVSEYSRLRSLDYEPYCRLSQEEKDLIMKLAQCRADIANFINAINGLSAAEKVKLFGNREMMFKWYCEVKPITDAVSEFINEIKNRKVRPKGTTSEMGKEVDA